MSASKELTPTFPHFPLPLCRLFCPWQTGAGKTHTMEGYPDPPELRGIIPKSFEVLRILLQ